MKIKILYLLLFLLNTFLAEGQSKYALDIYSMQDSFPPKKIGSLSGLADSLTIKKTLLGQLNSFYEKGYLAASIDSIKKDSTIYKAYIRQGKAYKWIHLNFNSIPPLILKKTSIRPDAINNTTVKPSEFNNLREKIITYCENNGYPFACLSLTNVLINDEGIDANLMLGENGYFVLDSLLIKGKAKISGHFLSHYLDLKKGDTYSEIKIKQIKNRISQLPYLRQIRPSEISYGKNKATIFNYLDNAKANRFNGIIGIAPNNQSTGNVLVTGEVEILLMNSFGKGESISFHWRKLESSSQSLDAGLVVPYILNSPMGADVGFSLFKQDSSWLSIDFKAGARFPIVGANYFKLYIENQSSSIIATSNLHSLTVLPSYADTRSLLYGAGIYFNSIDYGPNPHRGILINSELATGERKIIQNSNIESNLYEGIALSSTQFSGLSHIELYQPVWKKMILKLQNNSGFISNKNIFTNEMFKLGGLNSIRGFDDKSVLASAYTVFTAEFRYLYEQNSNFYLFFDGCHYERNLINAYSSDNPFGFGIGTNFETKAGIFSLAYALGHQHGNKAGLGSAKINFGFINRF